VAEVVIHLEPVGDLESPSTRRPHTDHAEIEAEIVSLVDNLVGEGACHRVNIWEEPQGLVASLHCSLKSELSVEEAHDLSEQWEGYLRKRIPALRRVLIHLEPT
jgi:divalent metal cation (Fe/Co/Zn/Cd) transporter